MNKVVEPKVITMYLPQFHRVPENDLWWGEGYTEWTAVQKGKKLFEGHIQPKIPLNGNYYNLLDKSTMQWQVELMKKYSIYGQCFYHYYFKDGKKMLEMPAEKLLRWKDVEMPFCFSWANESWARTWSNISNKNSWNYLEENKRTNNNKGILLLQDYGDEKQWKKHFDYLLPFFCDERYIKIDGKPVFVIYKPDDVYCLNEMIKKWECWAKENRLQGIFWVGTNNRTGGIKYVLQQEDNNTVSYYPRNEEYEGVCAQIIASAALADKNTFFCGIPQYDDTPRRGQRGYLWKNSSPELFRKMMKHLLHLSIINGNEFIFINAWNEWGEGMYLEPDEEYGYQYLEAVRNSLADAVRYCEEDEAELERIVISGTRNQAKLLKNKISSLEYRTRVYEKMLDMYENKNSLTDRLNTMGISRVAIYGMGKIGRYFRFLVENSSVKIICGIDEKADSIMDDLPIFKPDDDLPKVDAVVMTIEDEAVNKNLREKKGVKIIRIDELLTI